MTRNKNKEICSENLHDTNVNYEQQAIVSDPSPVLHHKPSTNIINNKIVMYNEPPRSPKPAKQNYSRLYSANKYNALNVDASSSKEMPERLVENDSVQEHLQNHHYAGIKKTGYKINQPLLPPLRQVSNAKSNSNKAKGGVKKRKLYNLDNLDYFDNFEEHL